MKKLFTKLTFTLVLMVGLCAFAVGQRTITGVITDAENSDPLIGANVLVEGSSIGTITDIDGSYSLNVPAGTESLIVSYTGYTDLVVPLGASNDVSVSLSQGALLDEIVVVGYGSVKKSDATGAVTSISSDDFNSGVITSPEQLMQGRAAGVQITSASGEPGSGVSVRIRGTSSVRNGNNPLFVVDGVPLSGGDVTGGVQAGGADSGFGSSSARNPLNFLNPNDIASIDILKDASATAIYGSRGANGVVLITTKGGKVNSGKLDYQYSIGSSSITKKYDLLSASEFAAANPAQNQGGDVDWQDEIFRTAMTHSHNISYGNSDGNSDYRFSLSYLDQEGIVKESGISRLSARFNGNSKFIDDKLKIGVQMTVANTRDDNVPITDNSGFEGDLLASALKSNPTMPIMDVNDIDGDGVTDEFTQPGITEPNPTAILALTEDYTNTIRALGNISGEYSFNDKLSFKTVLGFDRSTSKRNSAFSRDLVANGIDGKGRLYVSDIEADSKLWENYFTYNDDLSDDLSFSGLLGYSYQQFNNFSQGFELTNFRVSDPLLMINNIAAVDINQSNSIVPINSTDTEDELQSFFGRVNLGFREKYLLTASLRADGSTRFGDGNKYGYFPSLAFKWRVIQEGFMENSFFDDLGLRLGYGVTGNQEIPHNLYQQRTRFGDWDINNGGDLGGGGLGTVAFPNPGLKWESTSQVNLGIDFAILNYRLSGTLDFYNKNTNDLLFLVNAAQPAVAPFVWTNLDADIVNQGVELGLNGVLADRDGFSWDLGFNIAYNKNEVQNLEGIYDTGGINGQGLTGAFVQRLVNGQPLYAYFLREFGGFDDDGISIYPNGDVQEFTGDSPNPTINLGINNSFSFGKIDFSFFFTGQMGHSIYSNTENALFTQGSLANGRNVLTKVVDNGESPLNAPDVSTRFLESGDFLRLQNATLGYNFKPNTKYISNVRLFLTGQNLLLFTGYSGQDPEVNTNKSLNGIPSAGIDYTPYPRARTFTLGANVSF